MRTQWTVICVATLGRWLISGCGGGGDDNPSRRFVTSSGKAARMRNSSVVTAAKAHAFEALIRSHVRRPAAPFVRGPAVALVRTTRVLSKEWSFSRRHDRLAQKRRSRCWRRALPPTWSTHLETRPAQARQVLRAPAGARSALGGAGMIGARYCSSAD